MKAHEDDLEKTCQAWIDGREKTFFQKGTLGGWDIRQGRHLQRLRKVASGPSHPSLQL